MTIVERAAFLKGLVAGLDIDPETKEGKLWCAVTELLSDMAHEVEDLQESNMDIEDALDEISEELSYLEEITCDLDFDDDDDDDDDEEFTYDGILYDVSCPSCGDDISFDEATLEKGSISCPSCGENLEFDLGDD